ncbi:cyclopropane-fatty-acyl-phospholipid synthase family protein [soil metagenome]
MSTSTSRQKSAVAEPSRGGVGNMLSAGMSWPFRRVLTRLLDGVSCGSLTVQLPDGRVVEGRGASPGPHATIVLRNWGVLGRLLLQGDIGLAEGYRDGDWTTPDLTAVLKFGGLNEAGWGASLEASWPVRLMTRAWHLTRPNTRRGSRQNISFHYDMGNDFYAQWLDPQMIYSSALYRDAGDTLEQAQAAKLDRILELLDLREGAKVLEIGCGWGALALAMARRNNADVTGLTLSKEQLSHARGCVAEAGLESRIDLRLQDYRDADGQYDAVVSIEMLEAVGERYWPVYFDTLRKRMRDGGRAVVQVITIADEHFDHYRAGTDFIQRFIFPGGMLPSVSVMREHAAAAGLTMSVAESFGPSYAATLVEWRRRFMDAWPEVEALGFDMRFRRLWEYYLCYCEAGFITGRVDVGLYTFERSDR